jgi:hypothetical protein
MLVSGVLALGFGLGFVLLPGPLAAIYGLELSPSGLYMARLLGVELTGFGLLAWLLRNLTTVSVQLSILLAFLITDGIGFVVSLLAQLAGLMNPLGWLIVLIYLLLSLAFGGLYVAGRRVQRP